MLADMYLWGAPWPETITAVFTVVVAGGVVFAGLQILDSRKTRSAEIVQQLTSLWDSKRMIKARKLIATYATTGAGAETEVRRMAEDFGKSQVAQSDSYFLFTYHLNFWEQVGIAYGDNRATLNLVDTIFGDQLWRAWANWRPVLELLYGTDSYVGAKFRSTFKRLQRKAKWKLRRRELRLWLLTPYYDSPPADRRSRRRR